MKISIYIKGNRNSTAYYRIYQYFDRMENHERIYHTMMATWFHDRFMPISMQPLPIKVLAYFHMLFRMFFCLLKDYVTHPDVVVIHKRIISRYTPSLFNILLRAIQRRGCRIIWDFDDDIMENHEVTEKQFHEYARVADTIVVTHDTLRDLIDKELQSKVIIMPTTDGDMYRLALNPELSQQRLATLTEEVRLVWVGTSINLEFLQAVVDVLDQAACEIGTQGRRLVLTVVCDKPLQSRTRCLKIENIQWTRQKAIDSIRDAHIGIMPLPDTRFTRGKGAFKLIQYLSFALPCIGSNVGYNRQAINECCGILVKDVEEWKNAIMHIADTDVWTAMSKQAYAQWCKYFSYETNFEQWNNIISNK